MEKFYYPSSLLRPVSRLLALLCLSAFAASAQTLVWQENFDGPAINPDTWTFDFGDGCERGNCGWGNQELEYYTSRPENARIENGNLRIEARKESFLGKSFTSARLKTFGRMHFKYGTLEARIKVPNLQNGLWPAFWMLGTTGNWPASGEIDMMEMGAKASYPDNTNKWVGAAVHWDYKGSQADFAQVFKSGTSLTDDYHVYKLQWDASVIKVFIDNVQFFSVDISKADSDMEEFHKPQYVLLNLAVGGNYTGKLNPADITAPLPAAMLVDYLKLYQNPSDELYLGKDHAFAGDFGVYSERASITNRLVFDGQDASLYYWNNLTNITTPTPAPFEGQQVLAVHANGGDWFGMGVDNVAKNMGNFAGGSLKFQFKTTYAGQFKVGVKSGHGESWINFPAGGAAQYGLVRDGNWHEIVIPLSAFDQPNAGMHIDLVSMTSLFMFAGDPASAAADFYFDDVRLTGGVAANPPPTVSITAPASGTSLPAPATLTIAATAADANGTITKVEFYQGTTKLGEDTTAPYTYDWANVAAGSYSLTAKATDNDGNTTTSAPVTLEVKAPACTNTAANGEYRYEVATTGPNVSFTFHPLGATAGGNLALIYIREGSAGAYPGYPMVKNTAGDFTFTKAIASGTVTSFYFTYQVGAGGPEHNTADAPHSYTVGTSCAAVTTAAAAPAATASTSLYPNPLRTGDAVLGFTLAQGAAYEAALYDLRGARVAALGLGRAVAGQAMSLAVPAAGLANGIYLVKVRTDNTVLVQRLVVSH